MDRWLAARNVQYLLIGSVGLETPVGFQWGRRKIEKSREGDETVPIFSALMNIHRDSSLRLGQIEANVVDHPVEHVNLYKDADVVNMVFHKLGLASPISSELDRLEWELEEGEFEEEIIYY